MTAVNSAASKATTQTPASQSQKSRQILSKDMKTFLNLLTTQLKNQDPTSPMDTNKFTQQLTQLVPLHGSAVWARSRRWQDGGTTTDGR